MLNIKKLQLQYYFFCSCNVVAYKISEQEIL